VSDYFEGFPDDTRMLVYKFTKASVLSNSVPSRGVFSQCRKEAWHHTPAMYKYVIMPVQMKGSHWLISLTVLNHILLDTTKLGDVSSRC